MPSPSQKEIVVALMAFEENETRTVFDRVPGTKRSKLFLKYRCPKPGCSSPIVAFPDKSGFQNPYRHLLACYAKGSEYMEQTQILNSLYNDAREKKTTAGGTVLSHFRGKTSTINKKTIYTCLRLIILKNLPLSYV